MLWLLVLMALWVVVSAVYLGVACLLDRDVEEVSACGSREGYQPDGAHAVNAGWFRRLV